LAPALFVFAGPGWDELFLNRAVGLVRIFAGFGDMLRVFI